MNLAVFLPRERVALERNEWSVEKHHASRAYRWGNVRAVILPTGTFVVMVGEDIRHEGREPTAVLAAMEANNLAWGTPEYQSREG